MNIARLQFTTISSREVNGRPIIAIRHTARYADGERAEVPWIEMTPEDAAKLGRELLSAAGDAGRAQPADGR